MKDNILYVSAGPRNDNESERAVYAAVTKKPLEDNANVYADVKKDGKTAKAEAAIYSDVKPKKGTPISLCILFCRQFSNFMILYVYKCQCAFLHKHYLIFC